LGGFQHPGKAVTPAKAGVQDIFEPLDSGSRLKTCGDSFLPEDTLYGNSTSYEFIMVEEIKKTETERRD